MRIGHGPRGGAQRHIPGVEKQCRSAKSELVSERLERFRRGHPATSRALHQFGRDPSLEQQPKRTQAANPPAAVPVGQKGTNAASSLPNRKFISLVTPPHCLIHLRTAGREGIHHEFRGIGARKDGAGLGPSKGSEESEHGVWGDADAVAWNRSDDHGAGRQAPSTRESGR
jgi:hypothetical protein